MTDLRPLAWLAALAFAIGFMGYLAFARPAGLRADALRIPAQAASTSGPASEDWNFEKRI